MKDSRKILQNILNTVQADQTAIRSILDGMMHPQLRTSLNHQLQEYDCIEGEVHAIACQRGWELRELDPAIRALCSLRTRGIRHRRNTNSRIADLLIQRNTRGMIRGLKTLHRFPEPDLPVCMLSRRLLDCETANIRQMQNFL